MYYVFLIVLIIIITANKSEILSSWVSRRGKLKSSELEIKKIEAETELLRLKEDPKHKELID